MVGQRTFAARHKPIGNAPQNKKRKEKKTQISREKRASIPDRLSHHRESTIQPDQ
jgi:hypothetical protein